MALGGHCGLGNDKLFEFCQFCTGGEEPRLNVFYPLGALAMITVIEGNEHLPRWIFKKVTDFRVFGDTYQPVDPFWQL